jgi:hypothetical protein
LHFASLIKTDQGKGSTRTIKPAKPIKLAL